MKRVVVTAVSALFGLAPAIGAACEHGDKYSDISASATAVPVQTESPAASAANQAPAAVTAKAPASTTAKKVVAKAKPTVPEQRLAANAAK